MSAPLVHRETSRVVTLRYKVEAIVETRKTVSDSAVREALGIESDAEINDDVLAEYLGETAEDAAWDLHEVTWWDRGREYHRRRREDGDGRAGGVRRPSRDGGRVMTATIEDFAKTVAEYEVLAIGSGARAEFDAPEFTADGVTWSQVWLSEDPPVAARATTRRDGAASTVVVRWNDVLPADDEWRDLWTRRPMPLFGAYVRRDSIRHAFRDVVGDRRDADENQDGPRVDAPPADRTDWDTQLADAPDVAALDLVWKDMRADRARTPAREVVYRARRAELVDTEWEPAPGPSADAQGPATPERIEELARSIETHHGQLGEWVSEAEVVPAPTPRPGRLPQDRLPGNRAERRAAAKRKGRR